MLEVLQQLQFTVGALRQDGGAEGLHNLFDGNRLAGQLVLGGTISLASLQGERISTLMDIVVLKRVILLQELDSLRVLPDKTKGAHSDWLEIDITSDGESKECNSMAVSRGSSRLLPIYKERVDGFFFCIDSTEW